MSSSSCILPIDKRTKWNWAELSWELINLIARCFHFNIQCFFSFSLFQSLDTTIQYNQTFVRREEKKATSSTGFQKCAFTFGIVVVAHCSYLLLKTVISVKQLEFFFFFFGYRYVYIFLISLSRSNSNVYNWNEEEEGVEVDRTVWIERACMWSSITINISLIKQPIICWHDNSLSLSLYY